MSGGCYSYAYHHIEDLRIEGTKSDKRRAAFQKLLPLIAKALHDIEWVDDGDYSPHAEDASIDAVFSFLGLDPEIVIKAAAFDLLRDELPKFLGDY